MFFPKLSDFIKNTFTETVAGFVADARALKTLNDTKAPILKGTKEVPSGATYSILPSDNGLLLSIQSGTLSQFSILGSNASYPTGFNIKLYAYTLGVDTTTFYTAHWQITPGVSDEGNNLPNNAIVEIVKVSEALWATNLILEGI